VAREGSGGAQVVVTRPTRVAPALKKAGQVDVHRRVLTEPASTASVLGLCLFTGQGYPDVLARVWPLLGAFNLAMWAWPTVTSSALSQARTRLPVAVLRKMFAILAGAVVVEVTERRVFGLVVTAADGTGSHLVRLHESDAMLSARHNTPPCRSRPATRNAGRSHWSTRPSSPLCAGPAGDCEASP
jgi:hypothetical protein